MRVVTSGTAGVERNLAAEKENEWVADGWRCKRAYWELAHARSRSLWLLARGSHSCFLWLPGALGCGYCVGQKLEDEAVHAPCPGSSRWGWLRVCQGPLAPRGTSSSMAEPLTPWAAAKAGDNGPDTERCGKWRPVASEESAGRAERTGTLMIRVRRRSPGEEGF